MSERKPDDLYDEPLVVQVHRGAVILFGPGAVAVAMTAAAAEKSGEKLLKAARTARRARRSP
jgi:hypothetical protein